MKVRYYYDPLMRRNELYEYCVDIYMDRKGKSIFLGTIEHENYRKTMIKVKHTMEFLDKFWGSVNIFNIGEKVKNIKEIIRYCI